MSCRLTVMGRMKTIIIMPVSLPAAFESFISQKVASGCYGSAEEVVAQSLDLLKHQERWQQAASAKIEEGLRDLNAGRTLTDADSRREMKAFKSRWRAGECVGDAVQELD